MRHQVLFGLFVALTILLFLAFIFSSRANFRKKANRGLDFLCDFPFEAMGGQGPLTAISRTFLALFEAATVASSLYLVYLFPSFDYMMGVVIIYGAASLLKAGAALTMSFVPAYYFKQHLIAFMLFNVLYALAEAMSAICFLNLRGFSSELSLTFMVISFALVVVAVILAMNPRLSNWTKLKSTMEQDGSIVNERPRPFVLAATEWALFACDFVGCLVSILGFFLIASA